MLCPCSDWSLVLFYCGLSPYPSFFSDLQSFFVTPYTLSKYSRLDFSDPLTILSVRSFLSSLRKLQVFIPFWYSIHPSDNGSSAQTSRICNFAASLLHQSTISLLSEDSRLCSFTVCHFLTFFPWPAPDLVISATVMQIAINSNFCSVAAVGTLSRLQVF